jgi:hypothetical protein
MRDPFHIGRPRFEFLDPNPSVAVRESEYRRLLGYPRHHIPSERADELAGWARQYYAEYCHPWVYMREVELRVTSDTLLLDGIEFGSRQLREHLVQAAAVSAVLVAASASVDCDDHARRLWEEAKPDEYFFLEVFGSAVVESLIATTNGRICDIAEREGKMAAPHYSPGYTGWDVADQEKLFRLITRGMSQPFPETVEVLPGGMLRPKKSILAVCGLILRTVRAIKSARMVPCTSCSFSPCQYRRAPNWDAQLPSRGPSSTASRASGVIYTLNERALRKWAQERVQLEYREGGSIEGRFHFDGITCSSLGRPLAFDYTVVLSAPEQGCTILHADCRPAPGDGGYMHMCAFLREGPSFMNAVHSEKPFLGHTLESAVGFERRPASSGCYCDAASRAHKWGLVLEAIHYALVKAGAGPLQRAVVEPLPLSP